MPRVPALVVAVLAIAGALVAPSSHALLGSADGARVQIVAKEARPIDVVTVNCLGPCPFLWESTGPSKLTLECLDTGETSTGVFPGSPELTHPCIVRSTLEIHRANESVLVWRANSCGDPACEPWPRLAPTLPPSPPSP